MSLYAGYPLSTLRTWLSEAQAALPALLAGTQVVSLQLGDQSLTFSKASPAKLERHIETLQRDIADAEAAGSAVALTAAPRRAILPWG